MTDTRIGRKSPKQRTNGELVVDLVVVIGSALYLWVAQSYPPAGREIPTVVGSIALIVGVVQLVGWFVPPLWNVTHGTRESEKDAAAEASAAASPAEAVTTDAVGTREGDAVDDAATSGAGNDTAKQHRDTVVVIAWAAGFLAAILVLGYRYAIPVFFLAYFGSRRQWKLAVGSAVIMWALTQFVFIGLLNIHLPTSQFFVF
ncbi:tripartite tricarboxylate transporter TctB family protein [uncultured Jatrophihabitans sp.]|uniref:tripartite tricarboxylate transporter TctB family protein n=1 Tax=uncultured Jatrophihabitans sp. TaxID=1610747 RepID=UPI0035CBCEDC